MIYQVPELGLQEDAALAKIQELRRELRYYVAEPRRWVGYVRRVLAARAIQGSNSIEGYNVSVEDAVAAVDGDEPTAAENRDWLAVSAYRRAMTYVLQLAHDKHFEYSAALLRSLHFMMTEYSLDASPGLWRPGPIWVRNDATGDIVYEAPDGELVPELIDELVDQLSTDQDTPPMVRAAVAHLNLAMIHPFRDGNGRMSRGLQTLVLAREQILSPEWSSIEEYLGANTDAYYRVLAEVGQGAWNPYHDAGPWVRFCLRAHYIQAASVLRRVRESEGIWREIEQLMVTHRLPERAMTALFDAAIGLRVRNSSYRSVLKQSDEEISNQVATNDLRAMVAAGLLAQRGRNRGTYYEAAPPLIEIRARIRADRQPLDADSPFPIAA
jgi:Fic family protein